MSTCENDTLHNECCMNTSQNTYICCYVIPYLEGPVAHRIIQWPFVNHTTQIPQMGYSKMKMYCVEIYIEICVEKANLTKCFTCWRLQTIPNRKIRVDKKHKFSRTTCNNCFQWIWNDAMNSPWLFQQIPWMWPLVYKSWIILIP